MQPPPLTASISNLGNVKIYCARSCICTCSIQYTLTAKWYSSITCPGVYVTCIVRAGPGRAPLDLHYYYYNPPYTPTCTSLMLTGTMPFDVVSRFCVTCTCISGLVIWKGDVCRENLFVNTPTSPRNAYTHSLFSERIFWPPTLLQLWGGAVGDPDWRNSVQAPTG